MLLFIPFISKHGKNSISINNHIHKKSKQCSVLCLSANTSFFQHHKSSCNLVNTRQRRKQSYKKCFLLLKFTDIYLQCAWNIRLINDKFLFSYIWNSQCNSASFYIFLCFWRSFSILTITNFDNILFQTQHAIVTC